MNKLIVIALLVALVVGGAVAGLGLAGRGPLARLAGEQGQGDEAQAPLEPPPRLLTMETIAVPVFEGDAVRGRLFVSVVLEVSPPKEPHVAALLPRLQSLFLTELLAFLPRHLQSRAAVDPRQIEARLALVAHKALGVEAIRALTIKNIAER